MNDNAWDRITDSIDTNFGLNRHGRLTRQISDAPHLNEAVQFVEFTRQGDDYRLERITGPAITDRKSVGARRAGASIHYENVYDESNNQSSVKLLKDIDGEWTAVDSSSLGL